MKTKAFTLIELAISLTIIGLLIGGSFQAMKAMRERTKITEAKEQVETAKNAIIGYAIQYNKLPTTTEFYQDLSPFRGTEDDQRKKFFYFADPLLNNDQDICSFSYTNLTIDVYNANEVLDHSFTKVAFVVASQSINYNIQTDVDNSNPPHTINIYDSALEKDDNPYDFTRQEKYDDVVKYVTLNELKQLVDCSEKKLRILNGNNLVRGSATVQYGSSKIYAEGGEPFPDGDDSGDEEDYQWCVESSEKTVLEKWLEIECDGNLPIETDCLSATAQYKQCTTLELKDKDGQEAEEGTHKIKIYVKDSTGQEPIEKPFVITIDP